MINFMAKNLRKNKKKGFTLIELIIVIAILAILAAILVPSMVGYLGEANQSVADTNARTVYSAAAAASASLAATPDAIHSISGQEVNTLMGFAPGTFDKKVGDLLGAGFVGKVWVTVDTTTKAILRTEWQDESGSSTGKYEVPTPTPTP